MEHFIVAAVVEIIEWIDRRLQRPLALVVPNLGLLRTEPEKYLRVSQVQIGPRRRHALATFWGLVAGVTVVGILFFVFLNEPRPRRIDGWRLLAWLASFAAVVWFVRALFLRWFHGGTATLRAEGVELVHHGKSVFLPWSLFAAGGNIFEPDAKVAVLPIDPSVPIAVKGQGPEVKALLASELALTHAGGGETAHLTLTDCYEVRVSELAVLILEIGRKLRSYEAVESPTNFLVPIAVPEKNGWLCVQLTQLPFPPYCAGCGALTPKSMDLFVTKRGQNPVANKIAIPFCETCAAAQRRRRIFGALLALPVAIILALIVASILFPPPAWGEFLVFWAILSLGFGVPLCIIGQAIGRAIGQPVKCRDYKPEKGTVRIKLSAPHRAAPLLHAMGLAYAEPEAVEAVS